MGVAFHVHLANTPVLEERKPQEALRVQQVIVPVVATIMEVLELEVLILQVPVLAAEAVGMVADQVAMKAREAEAAM